MHPQAKTFNPKEALRRLSNNEAFHFFTEINTYTGKSAKNLAQFCKIINSINEESLTFHIERHDFEKWTHGTLHDPTLARRINKLIKSQTEKKMSEEKVRALIYKITKKRITELKSRVQNNKYKKSSKKIKSKQTKKANKKTKSIEKKTKK